MPANRTNQTMYLGTSAGSNIEKMNEATLFKPGELGSRIETVANKEYQLVQLDSGATSASSVGVVASGQVAYWKSKTSYIVTNDSAQAEGALTAADANSSFRNEVAGVFTVAATAGNYCVVGQKGTFNVKAASGGTYNPGNFAVANTGTAADVTTVSTGTAPTVQVLGKVAGARSAPNAPIELDLPLVP